jgi:hypothetical protein
MATERRRARNRKSISAVRPRNYSDLYKDTSIPAVAATSSGTSAPAAVKVFETTNWQQEYAYVAGDLRRLFIISGILFAVIVLAGIFM